MAKRKPISKKIRFEVFKRDKFTCQYCGRSAPDVVLEVDHIKPVAENGGNDIMNLVTSCFDCNRGKGKKEISDDSTVKKQMSQLQELQERREQLDMMLEWRSELEKMNDETVDVVNDRLERLTDLSLTEKGRRDVKKWLRKYSLQEILDAMYIAVETYYYDKDESPRGAADAWEKISGILNINSLKRAGKYDDRHYYTNYIAKMFRAKIWWYNKCDIQKFVFECINDESEFEFVKTILFSSTYAKQFWSRVNEHYGKEY